MYYFGTIPRHVESLTIQPRSGTIKITNRPDWDPIRGGHADFECGLCISVFFFELDLT